MSGGFLAPHKNSSPRQSNSHDPATQPSHFIPHPPNNLQPYSPRLHRLIPITLLPGLLLLPPFIPPTHPPVNSHLTPITTWVLTRYLIPLACSDNHLPLSPYTSIPLLLKVERGLRCSGWRMVRKARCIRWRVSTPVLLGVD